MPTLSIIIRDSGLTLSEIHRRSGISRTTLSRITNGRQALSRRTAEKLAPVLGVSAEEMLQAPNDATCGTRDTQDFRASTQSVGKDATGGGGASQACQPSNPKRVVCLGLHSGTQRRTDHRTRARHRHDRTAEDPARPRGTVSLGGRHDYGRSKEGGGGRRAPPSSSWMATRNDILRLRHD